MVRQGTSGDLGYGCIADTTSRIVDNALESLLVIGIGDQTEIGDDVLDFLALIETHTAIDAIRNALFTKLLLEAAALRIGAIENGEVGILTSILTLDALDILAHDERLLLIAIGRLVEQLFAHGILAKHIFLNLILVALDETVGSIHDILRTTIVLLQLEEFGTLQLTLESEDIVNIGTTETIDALRVITHGAHTVLLLTELHHDFHLHVVGILVLIDENKVEAVGVFLSNLLMVTEQLERKHQQVIEIHGIGLLATLHINVINLT